MNNWARVFLGTGKIYSRSCGCTSTLTNHTERAAAASGECANAPRRRMPHGRRVATRKHHVGCMFYCILAPAAAELRLSSVHRWRIIDFAVSEPRSSRCNLSRAPLLSIGDRQTNCDEEKPTAPVVNQISVPELLYLYASVPHTPHYQLIRPSALEMRRSGRGSAKYPQQPRRWTTRSLM